MQQLVLVFEVKAGAFFHDASEVFPELRVELQFVLEHFFKGVENFPCQPLSNLGDVPVFLEPLAGNIQGQIRGVHNAPHESQIRWQQIFTVFHDQDAAYIKVQSELTGLLEQIKRRLRRNKKQ